MPGVYTKNSSLMSQSPGIGVGFRCLPQLDLFPPLPSQDRQAGERMALLHISLRPEIEGIVWPTPQVLPATEEPAHGAGGVSLRGNPAIRHRRGQSSIGSGNGFS